ncbi:MAG: nucleotidyltransferase domain-containing protein, partial [Phenylobacterium sp.]
MSGAPRRAIDRAEAALARIDALGRGHVAAAVLVGSAVLGDWREDRSDVDLLLVSGEGLTPGA